MSRLSRAKAEDKETEEISFYKDVTITPFQLTHINKKGIFYNKTSNCLRTHKNVTTFASALRKKGILKQEYLETLPYLAK